MRRLLVLLVTTAAAVLGAPAHPAVAEQAPPLANTGYVLDGSPARLIARNAHGLAMIGVDGVTIASDGSSVAAPSSGATSMLAAAHAHGLPAELLVSNYSDRIGDFDPQAGAELLRDPAHVQTVASQLAGYVATQGWDGIQVDLESLAAGDAAGLTSFVQQLQADMAPEKTVSIAVMASTGLDEYTADGYQFAELGQAVDTMTLMTYDQHGPGWSGPGPVGARSWQRRCLATALTQVPATKVDLGVAGYGYAWFKRAKSPGRTVSDKQARRMVAKDGARKVWHRGPGEWSAHLSNGTVLWWSDARSYRLRVAMAQQAGLHGLSLWRLGSADPLP